MITKIAAGLGNLAHSLGPMKLIGLCVAAICVAFVALAHPAKAAQLFAFLVFGAVSQTYESPQSVNGQATTTAITAAQALQTNRVDFTIIATADGDTTTGAVTHAFGIAAGPGPTGATLANGAPIVLFEPILSNAQISLWFVSAKAANTITCGKATTAGSGNAAAQVRVHVLHHSVLDA